MRSDFASSFIALARVSTDPKDTFVHVDAKSRALWNDVLDFAMPANVSSPSLQVTVLDKDTVLKDTVIGTASLPLTSALSHTGARVYWLPIAAPAKASKQKAAGTTNSGEVRIGVQFIPYVQMPAAATFSDIDRVSCDVQLRCCSCAQPCSSPVLLCVSGAKWRRRFPQHGFPSPAHCHCE